MKKPAPIEDCKIIIVSTPEEYQSSLNIRYEVFVIEQKIPKELEIDIYEKEATSFLIFYKGMPAATGRFRKYHGCLKFERIATLKPFRGKNLGTLLMKKMQETALAQYPHHLQIMHAQNSAISFYEKCGWIKIGKPFIEANIVHQTMIFLPETQNAQNLLCLHEPSCPKEILIFFHQKK